MIPRLVPRPRLHFAVEDFGIGRSLDLQDSDQPALEARERMIDQDVVAGNVELELHDHGAAGGHGNGLYPARRRAQYIAETIYPVENFADHVEGGRGGRSPHSEI